MKIGRRQALVGLLSSAPLGAKVLAVDEVAGDVKMLVLSLSCELENHIETTDIEVTDIRREVERCLKEAGLGHVPWMLFRGIKVDILSDFSKGRMIDDFPMDEAARLLRRSLDFCISARRLLDGRKGLILQKARELLAEASDLMMPIVDGDRT